MRLFYHTPGAPVDLSEARWFQLRVRERWRDRLRCAVRGAVTPTVTDWAWPHLPEALFPLYYLTRPIRLAARCGRRLLRAAMPPLTS